MNIFDLETGSLIKSFFESDPSQPSAIYAQRSVVGVTINSSNRLFSVSTQGNQLYVSSFNLDLSAATLIPIYYKSYGSSVSPFFARSFGLGSDPSFAYVFGSINSRLSLQKLNVADGSSPFTYTVGTPLSGGANKAIAIGKVQQFLALYTIVGCAEGLGASQNDIGMLQYQETLLGIVVLLKTFYLTMTQKTFCRDFQFDTVNLYFTFYVANTAMYFGKADITQILTSLKAKELKLTSTYSQGFNMVNSYVFKGGSKFYYSGSTKSINSQAYAKSTALLNSYPDNGGLIAPETTKVFPMDIQTTFISVLSVLKFMMPTAGVASSSSVSIQLRSSALVSALDLKNSSIVQLPASMIKLPAQGVIYPPQSQGLYKILVSDASSEVESINLNPFSYSLNCSDIKWEYSAQLANGSSLPNFMRLETNSDGSISLKIIKADDSLGNFQIALTALLSGMYSKSITLPILIQKVTTTTTTITTSTSTTTTTTTSSTTTQSVTSTSTPAPTTTIISSTSSSPLITSQSTQTDTTTSSTLTTAAPSTAAITTANPTATETSEQNQATTFTDPTPTPTPTPQSSTSSSQATSSTSTLQQSISTSSTEIDQDSTPIPIQTPTPTNQPSQTSYQSSTSSEDSIISSSITTQSPSPTEALTQTEAPAESYSPATTPAPISSQILVSTVSPSENIQPANTTSVVIPMTTIEASSSTSSSTMATQTTPAPSTPQPSLSPQASSTQPVEDLGSSSSTLSTQTLAPSTTQAQFSQDIPPTPTPTLSQADTNMPSTSQSQTQSATPSVQVTTPQTPTEQAIITETPLPHTTIFQTQTQSSSSSTPAPSFSVIIPSLSLTPQATTTQVHLPPIEQVIEVQAFPDYLELGTQKMVSIQITDASTQIQSFSVLYPHRFVSFISAAPKSIIINPKSTDKGTYLFSYELKEKAMNATKQVSMIKIKATDKGINGGQSNQSNGTNSSNQGASQNQSELWITSLSNTLEIQSINDNSQVTFTYSSSIKGNLNEEIIKQILSLNLTYQENVQNRNTIKSWKVIQIYASTFTIQLEFEDSSSISLLQNSDYLIAMVNTTNTKRVMQKRIPAQFRSEQERFASTTLSLNLQYLLEVAVYGNFLLATFMGSSLQFIWTMINHLQLISHTPLFRIPYTANIMCLLHTQFSVVNFDTFQGSEALQKMFDLKEQEEYPPLDEYFEYMEYNSSNFIYIIGFPLLVLLGYLVLVPLCFLLLICKPSRQWSLTKYLADLLIYNAFFRYFMELSLESGYGFVINLKIFNYSTYGDIISFMCSFCFLLSNIFLALILPGLTLWKIRQSKLQFIEKYFRELTEDRNHLNQAWVYYSSIFVARRYFFILITFQFEGSPEIQLILFQLTNVLYLVYLIYNKPKLTTHRVEVFNEICTLSLSVLMTFFTDSVENMELKHFISYLFIVIYMGSALTNLIVITVRNLMDLRFNIRKFIWKRRVQILRIQKTLRSSFRKKEKKKRSDLLKTMEVIPEQDEEQKTEERPIDDNDSKGISFMDQSQSIKPLINIYQKKTTVKIGDSFRMKQESFEVVIEALPEKGGQEEYLKNPPEEQTPWSTRDGNTDSLKPYRLNAQQFINWGTPSAQQARLGLKGPQIFENSPRNGFQEYLWSKNLSNSSDGKQSQSKSSGSGSNNENSHGDQEYQIHSNRDAGLDLQSSRRRKINQLSGGKRFSVQVISPPKQGDMISDEFDINQSMKSHVNKDKKSNKDRMKRLFNPNSGVQTIDEEPSSQDRKRINAILSQRNLVDPNSQSFANLSNQQSSYDQEYSSMNSSQQFLNPFTKPKSNHRNSFMFNQSFQKPDFAIGGAGGKYDSQMLMQSQVMNSFQRVKNPKNHKLMSTNDLQALSGHHQFTPKHQFENSFYGQSQISYDYTNYQPKKIKAYQRKPVLKRSNEDLDDIEEVRLPQLNQNKSYQEPNHQKSKQEHENQLGNMFKLSYDKEKMLELQQQKDTKNYQRLAVSNRLSQIMSQRKGQLAESVISEVDSYRSRGPLSGDRYLQQANTNTQFDSSRQRFLDSQRANHDDFDS